METAYKNILEHLQAKITDLRWIDLDIGQLDDPDNHYQLDYPCVLINFRTPTWRSIGGGVQMGNTMITLRIAMRVYQDMNNHTPADIRNAGINHLTLTKVIHKHLQGWDTEIFSALNRISSEQEQRDDGLLVVNAVYTTELMDNSASPEWTEKTVSLSINKDIT